MATLRSVLRPQEADTVERLFEFLSNGMQQMGNIWGERPYLHQGRVLFEKHGKNILTVVEMYYVLSGLYRNGNYYKACPLAEFPGRFGYEHKLIPYRLSSATWRKAAEKHLVGGIKTLITERNNEIPTCVSKLVLKEGQRSLQVICRFHGQKVSTLSLVLTPAIEGTGWPEGYDGPTSEADERTCPYPHWYLVPPGDVSDVAQGWELVFPNIDEGKLKPDDTLQAALLLSWLAEKRGWAKFGLRNTSSAFQTLALKMAAGNNGTPRGFHLHVKGMLWELLNRIQTGSLNDFFVPSMNYLAEITDKQRDKFHVEVETLIHQVEQVNGLKDLCHDYPLLTPADNDTKGSSLDDMVHLGSNSNTGWLCRNEMDGGRRVEDTMSTNTPIPLEEKRLLTYERATFNQDTFTDLDTALIDTEVKKQTIWCTRHALGLGVLMIVLMAAAVVLLLPNLLIQLGDYHEFICGHNNTQMLQDAANSSVPKDPEVLPEPSHLMSG